MMTHAGAFEGIGGFPLAAERVGMEIVWSAENDRHASKVLAHHWPDVPNLGDVHGIGDAPGVDVLTGGFPCQDYSVAGTRGGLAGDRGALWWQYLRLIAGLRPTWVVGENVPGLLSSNDGADFETIVGSLTECGYGVAWAVLDAQYFGVAQRRRRVFIVGHSGGQPRPEVLALGEGLFGHPEPRRETRVPAAATIGAFSAGNHESSYGIALSDNHTPPLRAGSSGTNQVPTIAAFVENQRGEVWEVPYTNGINVAGGKPGQGYPAVRVDSSVRRLTPLECERLQGFPDGWTDIPSNSDTQRYRQLGNAVAVPVAEWILRNVKAAA